MPKLKLEDLKKIREKVKQTTVLREGAGRAKVTVHMGTCGIAAGARDIMDALLKEIEAKDVKDVIVNGKIIMKDRKFQTLDPDEIIDRVTAISRKIAI